MKKTNNTNAEQQDSICIENQVYWHIPTITNSMLQKMAVRCISSIYREFPIEPITIQAHDLIFRAYPLIDDPFIGQLSGLEIAIIDPNTTDIIHETRVSGSYYNKLSNQLYSFDLAEFVDSYTCFPIPLDTRSNGLPAEERREKWPIVKFNNEIYHIMDIEHVSGRFHSGLSLTLISCETGNMTTIGAFDDNVQYYVNANINPLEGEPGI